MDTVPIAERLPCKAQLFLLLLLSLLHLLLILLLHLLCLCFCASLPLSNHRHELSREDSREHRAYSQERRSGAPSSKFHYRLIDSASRLELAFFVSLVARVRRVHPLQPHCVSLALPRPLTLTNRTYILRPLFLAFALPLWEPVANRCLSCLPGGTTECTCSNRVRTAIPRSLRRD